MINQIVDFALRNRVLVLALSALVIAYGAVCFHRLPVEAYPDVANNWVQVITQWPGRAAEEVEQQVTIPIEAQVNGVGHLNHLRSSSLFGLSVVTLIFDDASSNLVNRAQVLEKLSMVTLPANVNPQLGPDYSPVGQIFFYTLRSTNPEIDIMQLKSLQDWVLEKQFKSVPNVADVSSFGGATREYQVRLNPDKLVSFGLSLSQVEQSLANNNSNAGGSFLESGQQQINVRAVGQAANVQDIGQTLIKVENGTPVRVRDLGEVAQGPKIRLGRIGHTIRHEAGKLVDRDDVVEGIVLLRKGAQTDATLRAIHTKVQELNNGILPPGVRVVPYLDRSDLVAFTTHTVLHNLGEGIALVLIVLLFCLGSIRSALIVALTIPFSLLFASILLDLSQVPANLLSLGALDFGMVVDGAVVMVENIVRHLREKGGLPRDRIRLATHEVQRPVFFAVTIIITGYLPIFTLQQVEGRLFRPMAMTVAFALLGALLFSLTLAPALASFAMRGTTREWRNPVIEKLTIGYRIAVRWSIDHRWVPLSLSITLLSAVVSIASLGWIGSEFLPHLDEGGIWARGTLPPGTGPGFGERLAHHARILFAQFPEVKQVVSQVGRPNDGTDTTGFFNTEYFIDLLPRERWRSRFQSKEQLIDAMSNAAGKIPGVTWNFSQPIADNMEEAVSGVKGQLAVKLYGPDLGDLERTGDRIVSVMRGVPGVEDLGLFRVLGQPNLTMLVDRPQADRYGINVSDVQDAIETAVGGKAVSQILLGDQRYDLMVRYQQQYRHTPEEVSRIRLLAPSGERVSLQQLSHIAITDGASMIYRENNSRYIAIKYSVRGRDLGSTVEEAMRRVNSRVPLPPGYRLDWAGEYASQKRANSRLAVIVPLTVAAIYLLLYFAFHSWRWASLAMANLLLAPIGGVLALYLTGTHFSISSGVGFLALFGVSVQTGVILVEYVNQLRARGFTVIDAAVEGAALRLRPILMTMLVATLGLLPAAMSHAIGSDSQRPFAIVIVGGLSTTLLLSIFVLPVLYVWMAQFDDPLPSIHETAGNERSN